MKPTYEELQAQIEVLRQKGRLLVEQAERALDFDIGNYHALKGSAYALDNAIDTTASICLAQVKADAVRDFVYWGKLNVDPEFCEFEDCAETFIESGCPSIRREAL
jgi:hypothetical protein